MKLRVTEIFFSLQGETATIGLPTVFVRLTGCPLRCNYCDTAYAFTGGTVMTIQDILKQVDSYGAKYVTVTGGEPLAQQNCLALLTMLCDKNYHVSLETSGALDIKNVDQRVIKIVDIKTPGSGFDHRNYFENIQHLSPNDQIKFVLCDRNDYEWAKNILRQHDLTRHYQILFSPSHAQLDNKTLAEWILEDQLPVRFQLQLHKYIWGDVPGR